MNALLGLQRFGQRIKPSRIYAAPKHLLKNRLNPDRSLRNSASLFAKKKGNPAEKIEPTEHARVVEANQAGAENAVISTNVSVNPWSGPATLTATQNWTYPSQVITGPNGHIFPIVPGENGEQWYTSQIKTWRKAPPFLDRHQALFSLLNNAYNSTYGSMKPVVTLATTSGGFGKTRLLLEWIAQIFLHPFIVGSFLAGSDALDKTITTDVEEQIKIALESADTGLFDAGTAPSIITIHADYNKEIKRIIGDTAVLDEATVLKVCKAILVTGITQRFVGKHPDPQALYVMTLEQLADYYLTLVRSSTEWHTFADCQNRPKPLLVIHIDEVQEFVQIQTNRQKKNLAFEIALQFFKAILRENILINMVGLHTGDLDKFRDQTKFFLIPYLPMDPLIKREYLHEVCEKVLSKKLYSPQFDGQSGYFSKEMSCQLHELWVTTCGIPRMIERMVTELPHITLLTSPSLNRSEIANVRQRLVAFNSLSEPRKQIRTNYPAKYWNKLLLEFIFCRPKNPGSTFSGSQVRYDSLESTGHIIPFHFGCPSIKPTDGTQDARNYTLPFYQFAEDISTPLKGFQGNYKHEKNPDKISRIQYPITIEMVIKVYGRSIIDKGRTAAKNIPVVNFIDETKNTAGQILEEAAATSLWMRYLLVTSNICNQLAAMDEVIEMVLFEQKLDQAQAKEERKKLFPGLYAKWKGVIQLQEQGLSLKESKDNSAKFTSYKNFLAANGYIAINAPASKFADIIAPLYDINSNFQKLLCIQCRNVESDSTSLQPGYVYEQIQGILSRTQNDTIYMLLSPNNSLKPYSQRRSELSEAKKNVLKLWEEENKLVLSDGQNFLSDWFLRVFSESFFDFDQIDE